LKAKVSGAVQARIIQVVRLQLRSRSIDGFWP